MRFRRLARVVARAAVVGCVAPLACAAAAHADFGFESFSTSYGIQQTSGDRTLTPTRAAGGHADLRTQFSLNLRPGSAASGAPTPDENPKDLSIDLPSGFIGNPRVAATCTRSQLAGGPACPLTSQVGFASVNAGGTTYPVGVFNIERPPDLPAEFGFVYPQGNVVVTIEPRIRPTDYGLTVTTPNISQGLGLISVDITLWGVPSDPIHDADRYAPAAIPGDYPTLGHSSPDPRRGFLSAPTSCSGTPASTTVRTNSYQHPDTFVSSTNTADSDGTPFVYRDCFRLPFDPAISVQPDSRSADGPTGLDVRLKVPQSDDPDGLAAAAVRRVKLTLPQGMSVSPSSAAGLGACAPSEIGVGTDSAVTCPDSAKLGAVSIKTPLLEDPLQGSVYLARQNDNPFGSLLALYLVAKGSGVTVKLPGRVDTDPVTGRLTTTFDNAPQLPFSELDVTFTGGPKASLASPPACGVYDSSAEITSWADDQPVTLSTPMVVDQGCAARGFAPLVTAGTASSQAGASSPFSLQIDRPDGQQYLSKVSATLPTGLLGRIARATLCPEALAATGRCAAGTEIGTASTLAGPGETPLPVSGRVYIGGPYQGAPFGLVAVLPTAGQAGPFDLGTVVVRLPLRIDPNDAHVSSTIGESRQIRPDGSVGVVVQGGLPTILDGFPLRLQRVRLELNKPGFMLNPTSCAAKRISTGLYSSLGAAYSRVVPYAANGCRALDLNPKLGIRLSGRGQFRDGGHPHVKAVLTQPRSGAANLRTATVKLPLSLALDPTNSTSNRLCELEAGRRAVCPKSSIVGKATATLPLLRRPLTGPIYFVKNVRIGRGGRRIKTLPTLLLQLRGEGVTVNVRAKSSVSGDHLVTTFTPIPDAPLTRFQLDLTGGKRGILVANTDVCRRTTSTRASYRGQNNGYLTTTFRLATPCRR